MDSDYVRGTTEEKATSEPHYISEFTTKLTGQNSKDQQSRNFRSRICYNISILNERTNGSLLCNANRWLSSVGNWTTGSCECLSDERRRGRVKFPNNSDDARWTSDPRNPPHFTYRTFRPAGNFERPTADSFPPKRTLEILGHLPGTKGRMVNFPGASYSFVNENKRKFVKIHINMFRCAGINNYIAQSVRSIKHVHDVTW